MAPRPLLDNLLNMHISYTPKALLITCSIARQGSISANSFPRRQRQRSSLTRQHTGSLKGRFLCPWKKITKLTTMCTADVGYHILQEADGSTHRYERTPCVIVYVKTPAMARGWMVSDTRWTVQNAAHYTWYALLHLSSNPGGDWFYPLWAADGSLIKETNSNMF